MKEGYRDSTSWLINSYDKSHLHDPQSFKVKQTIGPGKYEAASTFKQRPALVVSKTKKVAKNSSLNSRLINSYLDRFVKGEEQQQPRSSFYKKKQIRSVRDYGNQTSGDQHIEAQVNWEQSNRFGETQPLDQSIQNVSLTNSILQETMERQNSQLAGLQKNRAMAVSQTVLQSPKEGLDMGRMSDAVQQKVKASKNNESRTQLVPNQQTYSIVPPEQRKTGRASVYIERKEPEFEQVGQQINLKQVHTQKHLKGIAKASHQIRLKFQTQAQFDHLVGGSMVIEDAPKAAAPPEVDRSSERLSGGVKISNSVLESVRRSFKGETADGFASIRPQENSTRSQWDQIMKEMDQIQKLGSKMSKASERKRRDQRDYYSIPTHQNHISLGQETEFIQAEKKEFFGDKSKRATARSMKKRTRNRTIATQVSVQESVKPREESLEKDLRIRPLYQKPDGQTYETERKTGLRISIEELNRESLDEGPLRMAMQARLSEAPLTQVQTTHRSSKPTIPFFQDNFDPSQVGPGRYDVKYNSVGRNSQRTKFNMEGQSFEGRDLFGLQEKNQSMLTLPSVHQIKENGMLGNSQSKKYLEKVYNLSSIGLKSNPSLHSATSLLSRQPSLMKGSASQIFNQLKSVKKSPTTKEGETSIFKSRVDRLPMISGRYSSMSKPGPGEYETLNTVRDLGQLHSLQQTPVINPLPFKKKPKEETNPYGEKDELFTKHVKRMKDVTLKDKQRRQAKGRINCPPTRNTRHLSSQHSSMESVKVSPSKQPAVTDLNSSLAKGASSLVHQPIGHMARLAEQTTFYRNLKRNCIDFKLTQLKLSKRKDPSPGPGSYYKDVAPAKQSPPETARELSKQRINPTNLSVIKSRIHKSTLGQQFRGTILPAIVTSQRGFVPPPGVEKQIQESPKKPVKTRKGSEHKGVNADIPSEMLNNRRLNSTLLRDVNRATEEGVDTMEEGHVNPLIEAAVEQITKYQQQSHHLTNLDSIIQESEKALERQRQNSRAKLRKEFDRFKKTDNELRKMAKEVKQKYDGSPFIIPKPYVLETEEHEENDDEKISAFALKDSLKGSTKNLQATTFKIENPYQISRNEGLGVNSSPSSAMSKHGSIQQRYSQATGEKA